MRAIFKDKLITQSRQRTEKVFKSIYDCHYVLLCRFANQLLNNSSLSEEIVDDVMFNLWEHWNDIEITHSLRAYLMRAVRNRCLNELNAQSRDREVCLSVFQPEYMEVLDSLFVDNNHPLGQLLEQELEVELLTRIEELPVECRTVFKKSRFEQKKNDEIANELNISTNTVKYHIKSALSYLRKNLDDYLKLLICPLFIE